MKPNNTTFATIAAAIACGAVMSTAQALPPWKQGPPLHKAPKTQEKPNSQKDLFLVCKDSKGIILVPVKNKKEAFDICKSGTLGQNHECRTYHRVHWHNPNRKQGTQHRVMTMVDAEGQPCLTLARIK